MGKVLKQDFHLDATTKTQQRLITEFFKSLYKIIRLLLSYISNLVHTWSSPQM